MRFWLRAGVRIGCDLGRERGVPEMFWGRFGARLGTKLTISGAVDFALQTMQSSADAGGLFGSFQINVCVAIEQKASQNLSGCLTALF